MTEKPMTLAERLAKLPINKWPTTAQRESCEEFNPLACTLHAGMSNEEIDERVEKLIADTKAAHQAKVPIEGEPGFAEYWLKKTGRIQDPEPNDMLGFIKPIVQPSIEPVNDDIYGGDNIWHVSKDIEVTLSIDHDSPRTLAIYAGYSGAEYLDVEQVEKLAKCLTDIAEWMRQWDDLNGVEEE